MLTDFYGTWYTVYGVNLKHNSYWFAHLTYVLRLHYLGETSQVHNDNFQSYQPKLHITALHNNIHFIGTTTLNSITTASVQNVLLLHAHSSKVSSAIRQ